MSYIPVDAEPEKSSHYIDTSQNAGGRQRRGSIEEGQKSTLVDSESRATHTVTRIQTPAASGCCGMSKGGSIAFTVYMTTTIALALIGMLVCTGVLEVSFVNVGPMTADMGLYLMIAGLGAAVLGIISLMIAKCRCNKEQVKSEKSAHLEELTVSLDTEKVGLDELVDDGATPTWGQRFTDWHASNMSMFQKWTQKKETETAL